MDSVDLLAREEEFRKLNKQLEKKTISLMKEIENSMQKQDIFSTYSPSRSVNRQRQSSYDTSKSNTPESTPKKGVKTTQRPNKILSKENTNAINIKKSNLEAADNLSSEKIISSTVCDCAKYDIESDLEFLYAFVSVNVQMGVLPQTFLKDKLNVESVCKFLASKVKLMQEQLATLQTSIDRKVSQCENHLTQIAEHESARLKLLNKTNNLSAEAADLRAKCMALQNRLNEKDRLYKEQRSETDKLRSEVKRLRTQNASVEAKCVTREEEIDRLKLQVEALKNTEKEFRASTRSLSASHTNAISRLETKTKLLLSTIDKQKSLIENLKQQNSILSVGNSLKAFEKEYEQFLTQDF
ncbi:testis-expressed protein 9 [Plutella xylostella]|uniref:testis-expressed protein 9 n=1 Tax=Plutella xylostella TaxID=51655 RepID=UPI002032EC04|nr:testis-expressed protein 9 [Plutella xylostella]